MLDKIAGGISGGLNMAKGVTDTVAGLGGGGKADGCGKSKKTKKKGLKDLLKQIMQMLQQMFSQAQSPQQAKQVKDKVTEKLGAQAQNPQVMELIEEAFKAALQRIGAENQPAIAGMNPMQNAASGANGVGIGVTG